MSRGYPGTMDGFRAEGRYNQILKPLWRPCEGGLEEATLGSGAQGLGREDRTESKQPRPTQPQGGEDRAGGRTLKRPSRQRWAAWVWGGRL